MQSLDTGIASLTSQFGSDVAKIFRASRNNKKYEDALRSTWTDDPSVADYLLAHTNGLYVKKDESPRKGPNKDEDYLVMGTYLDDALARSEINARRERLLFALSHEGIHVQELRIHPSTMGMKERFLFPESVARINQMFGLEAPQDSASAYSLPNEKDQDGLSHGQTDQSDLLEGVKRAICQALEDIEQAWSILEKVEGAAIDEIARSSRARSSFAWYRCTFYTSDVTAVKSIIGAYEETIISKARRLGLNLKEITVLKSKETLVGRHAFSRSGRPIPLQEFNLQERPEDTSKPSHGTPR